MVKSRFELPDLLKGIAVILMIQVHITELFAVQTFYDSLPGKISLFLGGVPAAPLFMVNLGFFAVYMTIKTSSLATRGIKLIVWGFLLNIGLNAHLFYRIFKGDFQIDPFPYIFGVDILFLAGISLFIIALVKRISGNSAIPAFIIAILIPVLSDFIPVYQSNSAISGYLAAYIHSSNWWSYFPILPWLSYSFAGMSAGIIYKKYPDQVYKMSKHPLTFMVAMILVAAFFQLGFTTSSNLHEYYHHGIAFFAWAMLFLLMITVGMFHIMNFIRQNQLHKVITRQFLFDKAFTLQNKKYKVNLTHQNLDKEIFIDDNSHNKLPSTYNPVITFLIWTGKNVTAFYIIQWLLIGNLATALYKTQSPAILPFWFIGITSVTCILVWGWNKTKHSISTP